MRNLPNDPASEEMIGNSKEAVREAVLVTPHEFEPENHFYPRVLNASLHPMVSSFMSLGTKRIAMRYCHLHPATKMDALLKWFSYKPQYFHWAGADLFLATNERAQRQMIVIETNSCPSGQKSMPSVDDSGAKDHTTTGYHQLIGSTFLEMMRHNPNLPEGVYAVIYDKNPMEASGYAAAMSELLNENVYLVEFYVNDANPPCRWEDGVLHIRVGEEEWKPVKACFRYVTQAPWSRFPVHSKTMVVNTIVACLAGGRNKMVASKAYDFFNAELLKDGLKVRAPETVTGVNLSEIPLYVKSMGYHAVVKVPYSNAGQGVYTIVSEEELDKFMNLPHPVYEKYIVQQLVGNAKWSSVSTSGCYYHTGLVPNKRMQTFAADLRVMIGGSSTGYQPIAVYARRAAEALPDTLDDVKDSWAILGTNLSKKTEKGWTTETNRLLLMDRKDFNKLGIGIDELIDAYVQTVLAAIAIDKICSRLMRDDKFDWELFTSLNRDDGLYNEMKAINGLP